MAELFEDRETCDMLSDTFICAVDDTAITSSWQKAEADRNRLSCQFQFVFTLHRAGDPSIARQLSKASSEEILD